MKTLTPSDFLGLTCIVKREGWPKVYGTLKPGAHGFFIQSPGGSHQFSFSADDVAEINDARIITLKPLS